MKKFDLKGAFGRISEPAMGMGVMTGSMILAQKFSLKTIFKNAKPDDWYIKHEGGLKVAGVLITFMMWKKMPPIMKYVLMGIALQGSIQELRVLTTGNDGKSFVDQIGNGNMDRAMEELAQRVRSGELSGDGEGTGVGSEQSDTGVGGMGMGANLSNSMGKLWEVWQPGTTA